MVAVRVVLVISFPMAKRKVDPADELFKGSPEHIRKLHTESKKLRREVDRKNWWNKYGKPKD